MEVTNPKCRRQALTDAVAAAASQFAHQLADAIVAYQLADVDEPAEKPPVRRRAPSRYVPLRALPSPESFDKAVAGARRA